MYFQSKYGIWLKPQSEQQTPWTNAVVAWGVELDKKSPPVQYKKKKTANFTQ